MTPRYGYFTYDGTPYGYGPSGIGDSNTNEAIDSLSNMSGNAWNELAGSVVGYNDAVEQSQTMATAMQEAKDEYQGWADFDDDSTSENSAQESYDSWAESDN